MTLFVILDNVSRDGTRALLEARALTQQDLRVVWAPDCRGVADAYVRGYREALAADCDWILEIDAGFSHDPDEIGSLLSAMPGNDCVFGSRFAPGAANLGTPWRRTVSRGGTLLANLVLGTHLTDMTGGFELFTHEALEHVLERGLRSHGPFFQTEIKVHCRDLAIAEVPIHYDSSSHHVGGRAIAEALSNLGRLAGLAPRGGPVTRALVVTSIAGSTPALEELAESAARSDMDFILIGDDSSPADFEVPGCDFYGLERQRSLGLATADACPIGHYARKNVGYLIAMARGAETIIETDDDTDAYGAFWQPRQPIQAAAVIRPPGWVNVYAYFSDARIWPRGLPLDAARVAPPARESLSTETVRCPIQQGLVDGDPDVDAIYRLVLDLPFQFTPGASVALGPGAWCPFNSQNTSWWPEAYPLMYLPAYCSFRMTDIWRSFVAQRIASVNGWSVLFHQATVRQRRNPHDLLRDFRDEVPGYLANREICAALQELELKPGGRRVATNMRLSYELLVANGWADPRELPFLDAWLADIAAIGVGREQAVT